VITASRCDTTAMPAGTVKSLPSAAGITIALSPSGIAVEHTRHIYQVLSIGTNLNITANKTGITINLNTEQI